MINMLAVSRAINQAKIDLIASPEGILSLENRTIIWIAMNDPADSEASYFNRTQGAVRQSGEVDMDADVSSRFRHR